MDERFGYVMAFTADTVEPAGAAGASHRYRAHDLSRPTRCAPGTDLVRLEPGCLVARPRWGITPALNTPGRAGRGARQAGARAGVKRGPISSGAAGLPKRYPWA